MENEGRELLEALDREAEHMSADDDDQQDAPLFAENNSAEQAKGEQSPTQQQQQPVDQAQSAADPLNSTSKAVELDPLLAIMMANEAHTKSASGAGGPNARPSTASATAAASNGAPNAHYSYEKIFEGLDFKTVEDVDGESFLSMIEKQVKGQQRKNSRVKSYEAYESDAKDEEEQIDPPKPSYAAMKDEFLSLFATNDNNEIDLNAINQKALKGELAKTTLRGICWKIFLGCLTKKNPEEWADELSAHRKSYESLLNEIMVDPHSAGRNLDLEINNPLSQSNESPWQRFFEDADLKKQIRLDVIRVYPERGFFKNKDIQDVMLRVLFIYARQNPNLVYRQGMHELLAPMIYVLEREKVDERDYLNDNANHIDEGASDESDEKQKAGRIVALINAAQYVEHDAYYLFSQLVKITGKWFLAGDRPRRPPPGQPDKQEPFTEPEQTDLSAHTPVVQKCKRIQQELLRRADPELYGYLNQMGMEPQLYALRWVRLLLGREFHLEDVLVLWDAIFSYGKELVLVDYIIVAMLMYIRSQLLGMEYSRCLQRLFNYPPVEDVLCFIERALVLMNPSLSSLSNAPASASTPSTPTPSSGASSSFTNATSSSSNHNHPLSSSPAAAAASFFGLSGGGSSPPSQSPPNSPPTSTRGGNNVTSPFAASGGKEGGSGKKKKHPSAVRKRTASTPSLANALKQLISVPIGADGHHHHHRGDKENASSPAASTTQPSSSLSGPWPTTTAGLQARVQMLEQRQLHMSTRLERIIYTLQSDLVEHDNETEEHKNERRDSMMLALAELKQVRDILAGLLPMEGAEDDEESEEKVITTHASAVAAVQASISSDPLGATSGEASPVASSPSSPPGSASPLVDMVAADLPPLSTEDEDEVGDWS